MKRIVSFAVKTVCIFAVMFSLSTIQSLATNDGGNGSSGSSKDGGNTTPPIIIRPPR